MTGRHMITAIQAPREAGVRFGRVIARSAVARWMTNTPTAATATTRSSDAPLIMAPHAHLRSAADATNAMPDRPVRIEGGGPEAAGHLPADNIGPSGPWHYTDLKPYRRDRSICHQLRARLISGMPHVTRAEAIRAVQQGLEARPVS